MNLEMSSAPSPDSPHSLSPEILTSCSQVIVATMTPTFIYIWEATKLTSRFCHTFSCGSHKTMRGKIFLQNHCKCTKRTGGLSEHTFLWLCFHSIKEDASSFQTSFSNSATSWKSRSSWPLGSSKERKTLGLCESNKTERMHLLSTGITDI